MSGARRRVLIGLVLALAAAAVLAIGAIRHAPEVLPVRPAAERPPLLLLTSLPLLFGEDFSLAGSGSPVLEALRTRFRVVPISVTDPKELAKGRLLLMAQPLAQPAEDLVALDAWVRAGGRLLLFADPMLEWPSNKPLGDLTRAPMVFADTGLLAHWGLRLDAPDKRGAVMIAGAQNSVMYLSPGRLVAHNSNCRLARADIVALCNIGRGRVIVVADADVLNADLTKELSNPKIDTTNELMSLLDSLADRRV